VFPGVCDRIEPAAVQTFAWQRNRLAVHSISGTAQLYGFWNHSVLADEKKEVDGYCNLLFHMIFKNRARPLLGD
jgi:hypothetical protein